MIDAASEVASIISRHATVVATLPAEQTEPVPLNADVDLAVVLGGDGTLLTQSRRFVKHRLPMLGVNFGKLGFMAEFDLDSLREQASSIFSDAPLSIQEFPLLSVSLRRAGNTQAAFEGTALNEAVVAAGPPYRMITVRLAINGQPGPTISGDGLIVCTPLGSTAYNLSAGGPIVAPGSGALAITAIAAHTLSFRPFIVPDSALIEIDVERANAHAAGLGSTLVVDGQPSHQLVKGDRITIRLAGERVRFVKNPKAGYWDTLIGKLNWAQRPKLRHE
jgi:NAD+ kinase